MNRRAMIAGLTSVALMSGAAPAYTAATESHTNPWPARADKALKAADAPYGGREPFTNSYIARAYALRYGWGSNEARGHLKMVLLEQRPDGGWGTIHDGFAKSHAVSTAEHVGPTLLDAYRNKAVGFEPVRRSVDFLLGLPRTAVESGGSYVAPNSVDRGPWIHNINQAVGLFLYDFNRVSGYRSETVKHVINLITRAEARTYNSTYRSWTYREDKPGILNDADHNALSVEAMTVLAPTIGQHARGYLDRPPYPNWGWTTEALGYVRLNHARGPEKFDEFFADIPTYGEMSAQVKATRYAQLAYHAARHAKGVR